SGTASPHAPRGRACAGEPCARARRRDMSLELTGISVRYRGAVRPVLSDWDLRGPAGGSAALFGPCGAGRPAALGVAGVLLAPDAGQVRRAGQVRTTGDAALVLGPEVGWVLPRVNLLPARAAVDTVMLPALVSGGTRSRARPRAVDLLASVGITEPEQRAHTLYGGQAQHVGVARSLMAAPAVMISDVPTTKLDMVS